MLALSIRNKCAFLDGSSIPTPASDDPLFSVWTRCSNLIVVWLHKSLSPTIASTVFYLHDFSQSDLGDNVKIFMLQHHQCSTTQGAKSIDTYFNDINSVWEVLRGIIDLFLIVHAKNAMILTLEVKPSHQFAFMKLVRPCVIQYTFI